MTERDALADLEHALAAVVRAFADREVSAQITHRSGHDLPPTSWALLEHLDARGRLRVSDVAACHGVDVSSIVPRLKNLEERGLTRRDRAPDDARAYLIGITEAGRRALTCVHDARLGLIADALTQSSPSEVESTTATLLRIAEVLTPERAPAS